MKQEGKKDSIAAEGSHRLTEGLWVSRGKFRLEGGEGAYSAFWKLSEALAVLRLVPSFPSKRVGTHKGTK